MSCKPFDELTTRELYAKAGFEPYGEAYLEAGIRHIGMYRESREVRGVAAAADAV